MSAAERSVAGTTPRSIAWSSSTLSAGRASSTFSAAVCAGDCSRGHASTSRRPASSRAPWPIASTARTCTAAGIDFSRPSTIDLPARSQRTNDSKATASRRSASAESERHSAASARANSGARAASRSSASSGAPARRRPSPKALIHATGGRSAVSVSRSNASVRGEESVASVSISAATQADGNDASSERSATKSSRSALRRSAAPTHASARSRRASAARNCVLAAESSSGAASAAWKRTRMASSSARPASATATSGASAVPVGGGRRSSAAIARSRTPASGSAIRRARVAAGTALNPSKAASACTRAYGSEDSWASATSKGIAAGSCAS